MWSPFCRAHSHTVLSLLSPQNTHDDDDYLRTYLSSVMSSAASSFSALSGSTAPASRVQCDGTTASLWLAVGVMSSPSHAAQRVAVRSTWGRSHELLILPCFLVGKVIKRTPRAPWDKRRPLERAEPDGGPKGELSPNPFAAALAAEHMQFGDVLLLEGSAEIHQGGTSGLKTLTWWWHVRDKLPNVQWVGKCDDDTLVNVPKLLLRLPPADQTKPRTLFGTIKWGCYSDQRLKWEPSWKTWPCGRTQFARSQAPGEPANLSLTYEGPYELALGWFFAMPRRMGELLANCRYAKWFHERAVSATHEPFLRKEDDPLNGFWLYKCLKEVGEPPVQPLRSMGEGEAHNMACISPHGLYRRPSNSSIAVHFLKTVSAMRYVAAVLRWERQGESRHSKECCARMVWPTERRVHPPESCARLLSPDEMKAEAQLDTTLLSPSLGRGGRRGGGRRGRNGRNREAKLRAAAARAERAQGA